MENDNENEIFEKLKYYKDENKKVFFFIKSGQFRKGFVMEFRDSNKVILNEDVLGTIPILFSEIDYNSIVNAKEKVY